MSIILFVSYKQLTTNKMYFYQTIYTQCLILGIDIYLKSSRTYIHMLLKNKNYHALKRQNTRPSNKIQNKPIKYLKAPFLYGIKIFLPNAN